MIREADKDLKSRWAEIFRQLPPDAKRALYDALIELRQDALPRAEHSWKKKKGPMALYWKVVGVYSGHIARALKQSEKL